MVLSPETPEVSSSKSNILAMSIRSFILTFLLFFICAAPSLSAQESSSSYSSQGEMAKVHKYCNSALVERLLNEKEIWHEERKKDLYKIKLKGYNVSLLIDEGDIIMRAYFSDLDPSLRTINDFNAQYRWGRAYFDSDEDLTYAAELSFTGGLADEGIHVFINTYGALLEKLVEVAND